MTTATPTPITPGAVVTARPWRSGSELDPQRGVVFAEQWLATDEYAIVWFPRLGTPEIGTSVMPILQVKISGVRPLAGEAPSFIRATYRTVRRVNARGEWRSEWKAAGFAIEQIARVAR